MDNIKQQKIFFVFISILIMCTFTFLLIRQARQKKTDSFVFNNSGNIHIFPIIYNDRPLIGAEIWGGSGDSEQVYTLTKELNIQIIKEPLLWNTVEPTRGARLWDTRIDRDVVFHRSIGIDQMLTIKYVPDWARSNKNILCSEAEDQYINDFAIFIRDVAMRYQGKIYLEIGNEPDSFGESYWYGCWMDINEPDYGGNHYKKLLEITYPLVKQVNKNAIIVAGALMLDCPSCSRAKWVESWITDGNFDAVSFHSYTANATDDLLTKQINFLRRYTNKPLYITETSLLSNICDSSYDKKSVEWANFIKIYLQVEMIIWYTETPTDWLCAGLVDTNWNKKPVYYAWMRK